MSDRPPGPRLGAPSRMLLVGLLLVVAGGVALVARYLGAQYESHSFVDGQPAPRYVSLHAGKTYWISVKGGVKHEKDLGLPASALHCTAVQRNGPEFTLELSREGNDTKLVNAIASFRAPVTGSVHIACSGLSGIYLDNTSGDPSGLLLVLGTVLLTVGAPLLVSGVRSTRTRRPDRVEVRSSPGV